MAEPSGAISLSSLGTYAGWLAAFAAAVFGYIINRRKTDIDESTMILDKWKELVDAHEKSLATMTNDMGSLRERLSAAERRIGELETERRADRKRIRGLEEDLAEARQENAGLKASIRQNSSSAAYLIARRTKDVDGIEDAADKLDRMGDNLRGGAVPENEA